MVKKWVKKKWFWIGLVILCGGLIYWSVQKKPVLSRQINQWLNRETQGLYSIRFDRIEMDEISGRIRIHGLQVNFHSSVFKKLQAKNQAPAQLIKAYVPILEIKGLDMPQVLLNGSIQLDSLRLESPQVLVLLTGEKGKDKKQARVRKSQVLIHSILIKAAEVQIKEQYDLSEIARVEIDSLEGEGITSLDLNEDPLPVEAIRFQVSQFYWNSLPGIYRVEGNGLKVDSKMEAVALEEFRFIPLLSKTKFMHQRKTQTDRVDFGLRGLRFFGWRIGEQSMDRCQMDSAAINDLEVALYRDRRLPHDKRNRLDQIPSSLLSSLKIGLRIPQLSIAKGILTYEELSPVTDSSGTIRFDRIRAVLTNIDSRAETGNLNARIHCRVQQETELKTVWNFRLGDPRARFSFSGRMGQARLHAFNPLAMPLGLARFESGRVQDLHYAFEGDKHLMKGVVHLRYNDLRVALMRTNQEYPGLAKRKFASGIANLVLPNENPQRNGKERVAYPSQERESDRSFFRFAWNALFTGVKEVAGMP
ncbi:MAG: hypothetical protein J0M30_14210 [Chitinophagales bacterium]|nr:hypothetical protein [Chitinophagales bacterium]